MELESRNLGEGATKALWAALMRKDAVWIDGIGLCDPYRVTVRGEGWVFGCNILRRADDPRQKRFYLGRRWNNEEN